jgi:hypothetical protein
VQHQHSFTRIFVQPLHLVGRLKNGRVLYTLKLNARSPVVTSGWLVRISLMRSDIWLRMVRRLGCCWMVSCMPFLLALCVVGKAQNSRDWVWDMHCIYSSQWMGLQSPQGTLGLGLALNLLLTQALLICQIRKLSRRPWQRLYAGVSRLGFGRRFRRIIILDGFSFYMRVGCGYREDDGWLARGKIRIACHWGTGWGVWLQLSFSITFSARYSDVGNVVSPFLSK